jgi:hypothetical protein
MSLSCPAPEACAAGYITRVPARMPIFDAGAHAAASKSLGLYAGATH